MGTSKLMGTEEELIERKRIQQRKRRQRERARALKSKSDSRRKVPEEISDYHLAREVAESVKNVITRPEQLADSSKTPFVIGYKGVGRPSKEVGVTQRLRQVMGVKAMHLEDTKEYCELSGLDPTRTTVRDCVVHNIIHWVLKGSAPHLKEMMERLDGKVVQKVEATVDGKMSITDAVTMLDLSNEDYEVTEEE
jgi:hypothetical protein